MFKFNFVRQEINYILQQLDNHKKLSHSYSVKTSKIKIEMMKIFRLNA